MIQEIYYLEDLYIPLISFMEVEGSNLQTTPEKQWKAGDGEKHRQNCFSLAGSVAGISLTSTVVDHHLVGTRPGETIPILHVLWVWQPTTAANNPRLLCNYLDCFSTNICFVWCTIFLQRQVVHPMILLLTVNQLCSVVIESVSTSLVIVAVTLVALYT